MEARQCDEAHLGLECFSIFRVFCGLKICYEMSSGWLVGLSFSPVGSSVRECRFCVTAVASFGFRGNVGMFMLLPEKILYLCCLISNLRFVVVVGMSQEGWFGCSVVCH